MLDLIGRKADGWVPSMGWAPPEHLPEYLSRIEEGARSTGRDPGVIRCVYNVSGTIGSTVGDALSGPVSFWVDELARIAAIGVDAFIFWPGGDDPIEQANMFAQEVVPELRRG